MTTSSPTPAKPVGKGWSKKRGKAERGRADTHDMAYDGRAVCFVTGEPSGLAATLPKAWGKRRRPRRLARGSAGFDRGGAYAQVFRHRREQDVHWVSYRRAPLAVPSGLPVITTITAGGRRREIAWAEETVQLKDYGEAQPVHTNKEDLQAMALGLRPDLQAAKQGVTAAGSQYDLAKANGKRPLSLTWDYTHVSAANDLGFTASIEVPIFDRNQGEIARTHYAITQAEETRTAAQETVMTDVTNAYEAFRTADEVARLYESGYLKNAKDSRDISEFAFRHGAASLLDFLDAERSYRATELAYLQALGAYMTAVEQLKEVVGTRKLP